jgi:hypothetical protein
VFRNSKLLLVISVVFLTLLFCQAEIPTNITQCTGVIDVDSINNPYSSIQSNRFTHVQDTSRNLFKLNTDGFKLVADNRNFSLFVKEEIASIRILDKKSGYVWGCLETDYPDNLNESWAAFANSIVSIEYLDDNANLKRMGAGYEEAECKFIYETNGFKCKVNFQTLDISLVARVELTLNGVTFSVDEATIKENGSYYIANLYFAPFLGSSVEDTIPGYMFIPDGCGALMRFGKSASYLSGYSARVYGFDYAIDNILEVNNLEATRPNDFLKNAEIVSVPVYGIVHGVKQNAFLGLIERGAEYALITATPAGFTTDYNWASVGFIYHQLYQLPTQRNGSGVQVVQEKRNVVNPKLSIYFLSGESADYVGMARLYSKILTDSDMLHEKMESVPAGIALDFLMSDIQEGFFVPSVKTITSINYIEQSLRCLAESGISDLHLTLKGWQPKGLNGYKKNKIFHKTNFGKFELLKSLKAVLGENGRLSLYIEPFRAKEPQIQEYIDAAISLSQSPITLSREDKSVYLWKTWFIKYPLALKLLAEQCEVLVNNELSNTVAVDGGNLLYGEYLESGFTSRSEALNNIRKTFAALSSKQNMSVFNPNDYLFVYTTEYRNMPMSSSQYLYETDTVPFLQIVLSGRIALYAPYANDSFYSETNILKCIEYNCYPSFLLSGIKNYDMRKTASSELSSTFFDDWKEKVVKIYNQINSVLSNVQGKQIINHEIPKTGLAVVTYEDGRMIIVNYQQTEAEWKGVTIPALSAVFLSKGEYSQ